MFRVRMDVIEYSGIYAIVNTTNFRAYIGKTDIRFERRWKEHIQYLNRGTHSNKPLQWDWTFYGPDVFVFKMMDKAPVLRGVSLYYVYWLDYLEAYRMNTYPGLIYNVNIRPIRQEPEWTNPYTYVFDLQSS